MRSLAHIEIISDITPIENADRIEVAHVLGWEVVVRKDEGYKPGDMVVYIEIDSILDKNNPYFEFMASKKFKVKTIKLRGQVSQGLIMPISILPSNREWKVGDDVTHTLHIKKIEDEIPKTTIGGQYATLKQTKPKLLKRPLVKKMMKYEWFRNFMFKMFIPKPLPWPSWVRKTDEERIQNMPQILEYKEPVIVTEKVDGMSATYTWHKDGKKWNYTICSRNKALHYDESGAYGFISDKYQIKNIISHMAELMEAEYEVTLQGEIIGSGVQKNKYRIDGYDFYGFNLIIDGKRVPTPQAAAMVMSKGMNWVPVIDTEYILPDTVNELLEYATGQSKIHDTLREGVVIRSKDNNISFKAVSNEFLEYWRA